MSSLCVLVPDFVFVDLARRSLACIGRSSLRRRQRSSTRGVLSSRSTALNGRALAERYILRPDRQHGNDRPN